MAVTESRIAGAALAQPVLRERCANGLPANGVALPGDVSEDRLVKSFGDVAALAWKWRKLLSAWLQPVKGKGVGDRTEFESQYLFNTTLHPSPRLTTGHRTIFV